MTKIYYILISLLLIFSTQAQQKDDKSNEESSALLIEHLKIYPNPTTSGTFNIYTANSFTKKVEVFDLLGKRVFYSKFIDPEYLVVIPKIKSGIYIVHLTIKDVKTSRKLVVK